MVTYPLSVEGVGDDAYGWSIDGSRGRGTRNHVEQTAYFADRKCWKIGDVLGVAIDCDTRQIEYFLNGQSLGVAFRKISIGDGLIPAFSLSLKQKLALNFGAKFSFSPPAGFLALQLTTPPPSREGPASSCRLSNVYNYDVHVSEDGCEVLNSRTRGWVTLRSDVMVRNGQWMFELSANSPSGKLHDEILIGVCSPMFMQRGERRLGEDAASWAAQPLRLRKIHNAQISVVRTRRRVCQSSNGLSDYLLPLLQIHEHNARDPGELPSIISFALDCEKRELSLFFDGTLIEVLFNALPTHDGLFVALSIPPLEHVRINFGSQPMK